jgi:hypothetical protein
MKKCFMAHVVPRYHGIVHTIIQWLVYIWRWALRHPALVAQALLMLVFSGSIAAMTVGVTKSLDDLAKTSFIVALSSGVAWFLFPIVIYRRPEESTTRLKAFAYAMLVAVTASIFLFIYGMAYGHFSLIVVSLIILGFISISSVVSSRRRAIRESGETSIHTNNKRKVE